MNYLGILLIIFSFMSATSIAEVDLKNLTEVYQDFEPYGFTTRKIIVEKECHKVGRSNLCSDKYKYVQDTKLLQQLVDFTKKNINTTDPRFLKTEIGKKYKNALNFLNIVKKFDACNENKDDQLNKDLFNIVDYVKENDMSSFNCIVQEKKSEMLTISQNDIFNIKDITSAVDQTKRGELYALVLDQSLKDSMLSKLNYHLKYKNSNYPIDKKVKEKIVDDTCIIFLSNSRNSLKKRTNICTEKRKNVLMKFLDSQEKQLKKKMSIMILLKTLLS